MSSCLSLNAQQGVRRGAIDIFARSSGGFLDCVSWFGWRNREVCTACLGHGRNVVGSIMDETKST